MDRLVGKGRGIGAPLRSSNFGTTVLIPAERQATSFTRVFDMERQLSGSCKNSTERSSLAKKTWNELLRIAASRPLFNLDLFRENVLDRHP